AQQRGEGIGVLALVRRKRELLEYEGLRIRTLRLADAVEDGAREREIVPVARRNCLLHERCHRLLKGAPRLPRGGVMAPLRARFEALRRLHAGDGCGRSCRGLSGRVADWGLQQVEERVYGAVDRVPGMGSLTGRLEYSAHALDLTEVDGAASVVVRRELDVIRVKRILEPTFGDTDRRAGPERVTNAEFKKRVDIRG